MPAARPPIALTPLHRQRGAAFMVMLVILIIGAVTIFVGALNSSSVKIARDQTTADALAKAKEALIGRAISDPSSPGSLPCPDLVTNIPGTNVPNDGVADLLSGNNCPSYIGRLPWKTLGLPDLRDGSGERLWYALSPNFRDDNSNPINSNNKGTLLVYDNSGTTLLTPPGSEAVAIIFSAGDVVASQQRDTANQNIVTNYLDIGPNSINNATPNIPAGGPFIAADKATSFNDRLMIIRTRDIIPLVEKRVAKELSVAFANYITTNPGEYPSPANLNCSSLANCNSDTTQCRGWIPVVANASGWVLPAWFTTNGWYRVIYFSAGINRLDFSPPGCNANLTVSGTSTPALFFMPGSPLGSITRPSSNLSDYLEDAENSNTNDVYVQPGSTATSNDSLYILP